MGPFLLVVVDTEEEFDWQADFDRNANSTASIADLHRLQEVLDEFSIRPTYVVDYPIAANPRAVALLKDYADSDRATIGAHLHVWVNPPFEEDTIRRNSYQGNLDPALERRKLEVLIDKITETFEERPVVHKAGRYGFGRGTARILADLGVEIDLSAAPAFDFSDDEGPDYRFTPADPYWFGPGQSLLGLPCTGGFMGPLRALGPHVFRASRLQSRLGAAIAGTFSKTRTLERVLLSPEGHSGAKLQRLTRSLLRRGLRVFTLSLHSPTLRPGCTPYTTTPSEVEEFLTRCRSYFEFFFDSLDGIPATPQQIQKLVREGNSRG